MHGPGRAANHDALRCVPPALRRCAAGSHWLALAWLVCATICALDACAHKGITVHVVPHSHWDVGWLQTAAAYQSTVRQIIGNVLRRLESHASHRFIMAEVAFLKPWWDRALEHERAALRKAVASGQLEIVGGGVVMPDEAVNAPEEMVRQWTIGHAWLRDTLGVRVQAGWQIDPFGASRHTCEILADMGVRNIVLNRIDFAKKMGMRADRTLTFIWTSEAAAVNASLAGPAPLVTVLHDHYSSLHGFDWEAETAVGRGPYVYADNVDYQARRLLDALAGHARATRTGHVLLPYGNDFSFRQLDLFEQFDKLIAYINANNTSLKHPSGIRQIRYSTLSEYFLAVRTSLADHTISVPVRSDIDFFPYRDRPNEYWSGYYSSRPLLKRLVRFVSARLRTLEAVAARLVLAGAHVPSSSLDAIGKVRWTLAKMAHHDTITGTSRALVVDSYLDQLRSAASDLMRLARDLAARSALSLHRHSLAVFNGLPVARRELLSLAIPASWGTDVQVLDPRTGALMPVQLSSATHVSHAADVAIDAPEWSLGSANDAHARDAASWRHVHVCVDMAPLAMRTFAFVLGGPDAGASGQASGKCDHQACERLEPPSAALAGQALSFALDAPTGSLHSLAVPGGAVALPLGASLRIYRHTSGGAYLFYDSYGLWLWAGLGGGLGVGLVLSELCLGMLPGVFRGWAWCGLRSMRVALQAWPRRRVVALAWLVGLATGYVAARLADEFAPRTRVALPLGAQLGLGLGLWLRLVTPRSFVLAAAAGWLCAIALVALAWPDWHADAVPLVADEVGVRAGALMSQMQLSASAGNLASGDSFKLFLRVFHARAGAHAASAALLVAHACLAQPGELFLRLQTGVRGALLHTDNGLMDVPRPPRRLSALAGSIFPSISIVSLQTGAADGAREQHAVGDLALITEQAMGVAMLHDGTVDLMLLRRLHTDDERGLDEPLADDTCVQVPIWLLAQSETGARAALERRRFAARRNMPLVPVLVTAASSGIKVPTWPDFALDDLTSSWPDEDVSVFSFELCPQDPSSCVLLRLRRWTGASLDDEQALRLAQLVGPCDWRLCNLDASICGDVNRQGGSNLNIVTLACTVRLHVS